MSKNIWEEFDQLIDTKGLIEDAKAAAEGNGTFDEIPVGKYEVAVSKMELKKSSKGSPMLSIWFKIIEGPRKGALIFYNQVLSTGFGLHNAKEFLKSLESGIDVEFENFKQFNELVMDIHEAVDGACEYVLEYGQNDKGYNTYKIEEVFDV